MPYNPAAPAYNPVTKTWVDGIVLFPQDFANERADTVAVAVAEALGAQAAQAFPIAGASLSGHRVLMADGLGGVVPADPGLAGYQFAGISGAAAASGTPVPVIETGPLTDPSWAWTPGLPLFVGTGGALTQSVPAAGVLQQVAVAVTATTVVLQAYPPILLAP